jgi:hypothetical protein
MATVSSLTADVIDYLTAQISGSTATSQDIVLQTKALEQLGNAQDLLNAVSFEIPSNDVDWTKGQVFTKTLTTNTTLTFSNFAIGQTIDLVVAGNYNLTLPATVTIGFGEYGGTVSENLIQLLCTSSSPAKFYGAIINRP